MSAISDRTPGSRGKLNSSNFSLRARQYLTAYRAYHLKQLDEQTVHDCAMYGPVAVDKLINNEFKTHRSALDFDYKVVMST